MQNEFLGYYLQGEEEKREKERRGFPDMEGVIGCSYCRLVVEVQVETPTTNAGEVNVARMQEEEVAYSEER